MATKLNKYITYEDFNVKMRIMNGDTINESGVTDTDN